MNKQLKFKYENRVYEVTLPQMTTNFEHIKAVTKDILLNIFNFVICETGMTAFG